MAASGEHENLPAASGEPTDFHENGAHQ
jgi:hypothetical protein